MTNDAKGLQGPTGSVWSLDELWDSLVEFEEELKHAGLATNTVETYVGRSATFLRWLAGEYRPQGPRS